MLNKLKAIESYVMKRLPLECYLLDEVRELINLEETKVEADEYYDKETQKLMDKLQLELGDEQ